MHRFSFSSLDRACARRILAGCFAACAFASPLRAVAERPNVLFIAVDDLVPALGCYGDPVARTPAIDTLASGGVTFLNHYTQWAVCGPSRAALTTSLMPEETNVLGFKKIRDKNYLPEVTTLPQHFKNNGYETACTGKFHDNRTVGTPVAISETYPDGVMDDGKDVDDPASWSIPYVKAPSGFVTPTKVAVDDTDQADSLYDDHKILVEGLALIDDLAAAGGAAPGDKPFFLAVGFKKPHLPFVAPKAYWDLYDRGEMPLATFVLPPADTTAYNAATLANNSEMVGGGDDTTNGYLPYSADPAQLADPARQRELIHGYYACVSFIDNLVGQLLAKLDATDDPLQPGKKLSETTIVVLWGDHGFHLGDHGKWAKHTAMDAATASPLIIYDPRAPKAPPGTLTDSPAGTTDIFPTLCELAALPIPEQPATTASTSGRPLRGRSLVPVINDPTASVHHGVVSQFNISGQYGYAYRTPRFRYIEWVNASGNMNDGNARRDLFDYEADPLESVNLADDPAYAAIVYQLSRSLRAETTIRGTGRLQLAAPVAAGGDAFLPDASIAADGAGFVLAWPSSGGVSYDILGSATLAGSSWVEDLADIQGPDAVIPPVGAARFFRVGFGENTPPVFSSDPLLGPIAAAGEPYSASLAGKASDADPGDPLTFSKISGPGWLAVAADGTLSGTPAEGEEGAHYFVVSAEDPSGNSQRATLQITVEEPPPPPPPSVAPAGQGDVSGSGTYGGVFFSAVSVEAGDILVIAHANNKNSASNQIALTGLGGNTVSHVESGSTGTGSSAWVFYSAITVPGTYSISLDTSNATKSVSHATSYFILRPENGTLSVAGTAFAAAPASPGTTSLPLEFALDPAVADGFAIAAAATGGSAFTANPAGWTQQLNSNDKRRTLFLDAVAGTSLSASFGSSPASDMALAGLVISAGP